MNMTYVSLENTDQETGEEISVAHKTEYVAYDDSDARYGLTIIEGEGEDLTPESSEVQAALQEAGFPLTGWELA